MSSRLRFRFASAVFPAAWLALAAVGGAGAMGACSADAKLGSENGSGGGGAASPACKPTSAPCAVLFTFPFNNEQSVELRGDYGGPDTWNKGVPMQLDGLEWRASVAVQNGAAIHYKFYVNGSQWVADPLNQTFDQDGNSVTAAHCTTTPCPMAGTGGAAGTTSSSTGSGGSTEPPPGQFDWRSAVLYFVFVDRFSNGDATNDAPIANVESKANYQGGDYAGLLAKIDAGYFETLGVNALWLTVPMDNTENPGAGSDGHQYSAYHGYWPTKLDQVEEHFGDMALLKTVVDHAHTHEIKVLLDYAMNHVHQDSPVYAAHPDWFWPIDYNGKNCVCGDGCDWNDPYEQKRCWFTSYLPDWNFTLPEARAYSVDNAISWIKNTGIDGFRLDAVKHIEKQWIVDLRARVTSEIEPISKQHFYMVGETFESGNRDLIKSFVDPKTLLDGQFDFPLRGFLAEKILMRLATFSDLDTFLSTNDGYYGSGSIMSTFLGNHDLARTVHLALDQPLWGAWDNGGTANWDNPPSLPDYTAPFERLGVAYALLFTTSGIPLLYYGDEVALPGAGDPDNRRFMQWSGYDPNQLFLKGRIGKLGAIRAAHPALWKGKRVTTSVTADTYGYSMTAGADVVYVALNRGDLPGGVNGMPASGHDLLTDADVPGPQITVPPRSAMVIVAK